MNIGLLGLTFGYKHSCNNRGCEALTISFFEILNEIAKQNDDMFQVFLFVPVSIRKIQELIKGKAHLRSVYLIEKDYSNLNLDIIWYWIYKGYPHMRSESRKCDIIIDFTSGDSFTDIYGDERYITLTDAKKQVMNMNIPLALGSQTIGPFVNPKIEKDAANVINRCREVFVRDQLSYDYVEKISNRQPIKTTDVAFFLPYNEINKEKDDKIVIGFNPSGLLWHGGYNRNNQFGMKFDYQEYCAEVIEKLLKNKKYRIVLIPHAYSSNMKAIDNDLIPVMELKNRFPECSAITEAYNSMEIKSRINQCDVFIGARMHATIGAFSSGIPTIPVAYSRKFSGLYNEYGYSYVIDANRCSLDEAVDKTIGYIEDLNTMKEVIEETRFKIEENKERILEVYSGLLKTV